MKKDYDCQRNKRGGDGNANRRGIHSARLLRGSEDFLDCNINEERESDAIAKASVEGVDPLGNLPALTTKPCLHPEKSEAGDSANHDQDFPGSHTLSVRPALRQSPDFAL